MASFFKVAKCCVGPEGLPAETVGNVVVEPKTVDPDSVVQFEDAAIGVHLNKSAAAQEDQSKGIFPDPPSLNLKEANTQEGDGLNPDTPSSNLKEANKQEGGGLNLTFQTFNKDPQTLSFTKAPLGFTFGLELPLVVTGATDDAKQKGVQVGWTILRINDQVIADSGMTHDECFKLLKTETEKLPLVDKVANICFQGKDGNVVRYAFFTQKPFGMTLDGNLKVLACAPEGEAAQKSVEPGWTICSVNGQDLTKSSTDSKSDALKALQEAISYLPESPVVGA
eukprot:gnl/MRDRNA2_/MRDRNA2_68303_c0_seq1.p1 gnl/MRDRNA2_/MRDRNA2_68303_c0~~gnl/MRDRNA2_/MRDRNA2_68303_c0_seq1.p1  ORF type:complete len:281 (+),score=64.80 gnl/MRDRNA2_/MRDRNA2_68303_c0_seq1:79-921(+)